LAIVVYCCEAHNKLARVAQFSIDSTVCLRPNTGGILYGGNIRQMGGRGHGFSDWESRPKILA